MNKDQKAQVIENVVKEITSKAHLYITDTTGLDAEGTSKLRRMCFRRDVKLLVVKNTLLKKALEQTGTDYSELFPALKGTSAIMLSDINSAPAKIIKEFRGNGDKPVLKGAFVEESFYLGDAQLQTLVAIKSKNELIGDIIGMLQSPLSGILSGLEARAEKEEAAA